MSMEIQPGQLVSEKEIASVLNSSKTPVREALIRLEDVGLVAVVPKSGTYVTPIRIDSYIEGCFIRLQLEIGAVRRAASRPSNDSCHQLLDEILEQQVVAWSAEDYVHFATLDEELHEAFFTAAGLDGVWHFHQKTQADVNRVRHLKRINGIRRGLQVIEAHKVIVSAIKSGDEQASEDALIAHIGSLESEIERLAQNPGLLAFIENQDSSAIRKLPSRRATWSTRTQQFR